MEKVKLYFFSTLVVGLLLHEGASITFPKIQKVSIDERLQHIENTCAQPHHQRSSTVGLANTLGHLLVNDEHGLLYCYVPKVACSNWKRVMTVLDKKANNTDEIDHPHNGFKSLSNYTASDILYRLKHYYKFMFVREPLHRLVSAYKDKLTGKNDYYTKTYGDPIVHRFRPLTGKGNDVHEPWPTLEEFFMHLNAIHPLSMDEHWMPMHWLCQPCVIKYDFIGTLENIDEDSEEVLDELNLKGVVHFPRQQMKYKNKNGRSTNELLNQIPKPLLRSMLNRYRDDYELFQYPRPDDVN